jgi:DNA adenine methylase
MRLPLFIIKTAGTKSWFVPYALEFLGDWHPKTIVEPFGGSCVVSLSLLHEGFTERLVLAEKDMDYLAFWRTALGDSNFSYRVSKWTEQVLDLPFERQKPFVEASLKRMEAQDPGFWILLCSRVGFNGKKVGGFMTEHQRGGILCRWPRTLDASLDLLYSLRNKIIVMEDAFDAMTSFDSEDSYAFIDPPYTVTEKCPGHQIYDEAIVDHDALISTLTTWKGRWQLTYNLTPLPIIPKLYQWKLAGHAEIAFLEMLSGNGNGGSGKKSEMLVSKVSGEQVPRPERMDQMVLTAELHRQLLWSSMPKEPSKRLIAETTRGVLGELRNQFAMNAGVVLATQHVEARNESPGLGMTPILTSKQSHNAEALSNWTLELLTENEAQGSLKSHPARRDKT